MPQVAKPGQASHTRVVAYDVGCGRVHWSTTSGRVPLFGVMNCLIATMAELLLSEPVNPDTGTVRQLISIQLNQVDR